MECYASRWNQLLRVARTITYVQHSNCIYIKGEKGVLYRLGALRRSADGSENSEGVPIFWVPSDL